LPLATSCTTPGVSRSSQRSANIEVTQESPPRFYRVKAYRNGDRLTVRGRGRRAVLRADHVHVQLLDRNGAGFSEKRVACFPNARKQAKGHGLGFVARFSVPASESATAHVTYHRDSSCGA